MCGTTMLVFWRAMLLDYSTDVLLPSECYMHSDTDIDGKLGPCVQTVTEEWHSIHASISRCIGLGAGVYDVQNMQIVSDKFWGLHLGEVCVLAVRRPLTDSGTHVRMRDWNLPSNCAEC